MTFIYRLNGLDTLILKPLPTRKYPYNHWGCKPVVGVLIESDKIVATPSRYTAPILFEIEASGILDADKMFLNATGIKAERRPDIGCEIIK